VNAIGAILRTNASLLPAYVRLAWHASASYDPNATGYKYGSYGATIRFPKEYCKQFFLSLSFFLFKKRNTNKKLFK